MQLSSSQHFFFKSAAFAGREAAILDKYLIRPHPPRSLPPHKFPARCSRASADRTPDGIARKKLDSRGPQKI